MQFYPSDFRIANRYEVAGRPLLGGMGIVYLCFDHEEQRPVALKTFKPEYLPDRAARERFLEEGNTWVRLGKHPHIVRCYDVVRIGDGREVYLVLELVAKEEDRRDASLRSWLTSGQPLPTDQALLIALQIVRGMRHATEIIPGFVHRDLKPENVLVGAHRLSNAPVNRVRVTDFGLAKSLRAEQVSEAQNGTDRASRPGQLTRADSVLGTPHYMVPEQWDGADVTMQADIYALGCILGEMLAGHLLIQGGTLSELRWAHESSQALAAVPPPLRDVLATCLAVDPDQRYKCWAALETALPAAYRQAAGEPVPEAEAASVLSRAERVAAGWSFSEMGASYLDIGNAQAALGYFERARQVGKVEGEHRLEAAGLTHLGLAYADLGDAHRAVRFYEQALAISRKTGSRLGEGAALGNLGEAYRRLGDARRAIDYHEQARTIHRQISDRRGEGQDLGNLGLAYANLGDHRRAIGCFERALVINRAIGDRGGEGSDLGNLGSVCLLRGDVQQAIDYLNQSLAIFREIGDRHGEGTDLGNLGNAYSQLGDARRAIEYHQQALAIRREIDDRRGAGQDLSNLGYSHEQLGDVRRAIGFCERALTIFYEIGDANGVASVSLNLAVLHDRQGNPAQALTLAQEAARLFTQMGHTTHAHSSQQLVAQLERQGR